MYIITQFFKTDINTINTKLTIILDNIKVNDLIYVFSDVRMRINDIRVKIFPIRSRLKWSQIFKFIKESDSLNKKGCLCIDPNFITNEFFENSYKIDYNESIFISDNNDFIFCKNISKEYKINRFVFKDYNFLKMNIKKYKIQIASICHIYYEDLLEEMVKYNLNINKIESDIEYYFTLTEDSSTIGQKEWVIKTLEDNFPGCTILILPNKGLDIGPFFKVLINIIESNKKYDYIVKSHTKKSILTSGKYFGKKWRSSLLSIMSDDKLDKVQGYIESNSEMIGSNKWCIPFSKDVFNKKSIDHIFNNSTIEKKGDRFIGGTMFWIRFDILKNNFDVDFLNKHYKLMDSGYFYQISESDDEYTPHSFERIFGIMCSKIDLV